MPVDLGKEGMPAVQARMSTLWELQRATRQDNFSSSLSMGRIFSWRADVALSWAAHGERERERGAT